VVLDEWIPHPPDSGKRVRTWNLLRLLARRHQVSLLCYGDSESEAARVVRSAGITLHAVPPLPKLGGWRLYWRLFGNLFSPYPYSVSKHDTRRFRDCLRLLLERNHFDLLHFEWTPYARFMDEIGGIPNLIMAHNIESQIWSRRARQSRTLLETAYFGLQARKMKWFERRVMRHADCVAVVTELDAEQATTWGARQTVLVENGVDLDTFVPAVEDAGEAQELLFLGSLDWYPNLDAVEYLIEKILPLVLAHVPEAKLRIVGRCSPPELAKRIARCSGVDLVGEVADIRPHLARAAVVLVPLRVGGGSRIKILEALAMGKAVVSTTIGAEGLAVSDGVHVLLADSPANFAERTVELLASPERRARLGERGRKLVEERYTWDRAAEALESAWLRLCQPQAVIDNPEVHASREVQASP
jgi:sugar transferase (PEP-CTERM/EpsH1 system associated)